MVYDPALRSYVCTGCGLMLTRAELIAERERARQPTAKQLKRVRRREYIEWWIKKKR